VTGRAATAVSRATRVSAGRLPSPAPCPSTACLSAHASVRFVRFGSVRFGQQKRVAPVNVPLGGEKATHSLQSREQFLLHRGVRARDQDGVDVARCLDRRVSPQQNEQRRLLGVAAQHLRLDPVRERR